MLMSKIYSPMALLRFEAKTWREGILLGHFVVWILSAYSYWFVRKLPFGFPRVLASTPILVVYALIPLIWSPETHLVGVASFFNIITWLGSFKMLLLCWGKGPGYDPWVASSFPRFAIVMTYPAHMKRAEKVLKREPGKHSSWVDQLTKSEEWYMLLLRSALKLIPLAIVLQLMMRGDSFSKLGFHLLCSVQLYLFVTILMEVLAAVANLVFGVAMEPHFDNPLASVSLKEFWARRWNLVVSNSLRETVYNPVLYLLQGSKKDPQNPSSISNQLHSSSPTSYYSDKPHDPALTQRLKHSPPDLKLTHTCSKDETRGMVTPQLVAMLAAFLVSGLYHELAFYYITRNPPTWEITCFFVVQGIAVAVESAWKVHYPKVRSPKLVSRILTVGFVFITAHLLLWPPVDLIAGQAIVEQKIMLGFK